MTLVRALAVLALAAGAAAPVAANATESCYYDGRLASVCRDPEYRACLLYGDVAGVPWEAGNGCP